MTKFASQENINRALLSACYKGEYDRAKKLIQQNGADVNTTDKEGNSALHKAAGNSHTKVCRLLVENDARINVFPKKGYNTPLERAIFSHPENEVQQIETVRYLLSQGGKIYYDNAPDVECSQDNFTSTLCANYRYHLLGAALEATLGKKGDPIPYKLQHDEKNSHFIESWRNLRQKAANESDLSFSQNKKTYEKALEIAAKAALVGYTMQFDWGGKGIDDLTLSMLHPIMATPDKVHLVHETVGRFSSNDCSDVNDMIYEYTKYITLPMYFAKVSEQFPTQADTIINSYDEKKTSELVKKLVPATSKALFQHRGVDTVLGLSAAWHDERNAFPAILRPLRHTGEWHPILQPPVYEFKNGVLEGYRVECLSNSEQLLDEGRRQSLCLQFGNYDLPCMEGKSHILSIKDRNGNTLSTAELKPDELASYRAIAKDKNGLSIVEKQHRGLCNSEPPEIAKQVWNTFLEEVRAGKISLQSEQIGETEASKAINDAKNLPYIVGTIGFKPTSDAINAAYNEYKNSKRRAMYFNEQTGKFDRQHRHQDFLSGSYMPAVSEDSTGNAISLRDDAATAEMWSRATGMDKFLDKQIRNDFPNLFKYNRETHRTVQPRQGWEMR